MISQMHWIVDFKQFFVDFSLFWEKMCIDVV